MMTKGVLFHFSFLSYNKFQRKLKLFTSLGILSQAFQTAVGKSFLPLPYTQGRGVNYFSSKKVYIYCIQYCLVSKTSAASKRS